MVIYTLLLLLKLIIFIQCVINNNSSIYKILSLFYLCLGVFTTYSYNMSLILSP